MCEVTVYGFPISTYVNIVRVVLAHKGVPFDFEDLEAVMGGPAHLALHPFGRVPVLRHRDFVLYETGAIVRYIDRAFDGPPLQPKDPQRLGRMDQWIGAVDAYYYPYAVYHLSHERLIFPALGVAPDEKVVAAAMPKIVRGVELLEAELGNEGPYLAGDLPCLADFFMLPMLTSLSMTPEGAELLADRPAIAAWRARMEAMPSVQAVRAMVAPHIGKPVEHARAWVKDHRPVYA